MAELYKGVWSLTGTANQNNIVRGALDRIKFPWDKIVALNRPIPIGWMDLNTAERQAVIKDYMGGTDPIVRLAGGGDHDHDDDHGLDADQIPGHIHVTDEEGNEGHGILRFIEGRWLIAGVFWTDGRIYIDIRLEDDPAVAQEVVSAEIAHSVDYGLPLNDAQKSQISGLFHPSGSDSHTWWEKQDYGTEYYTLVGESFMALFTHSYSDMEPWQDPFTHKSTKAMAPDVYRILGIQPTDAAPPPPPVTDFDGFMAQMKQSTLYKNWRNANPGESLRFDQFVAGSSEPKMVTPFGRALIYVVRMRNS